jgi:Putative transmembrane protein (PGPGW)
MPTTWIIVLVMFGAVSLWNLYGLYHLRRAMPDVTALALLKKQLRRAWVLIAGTVIILIGVIISPLPGPGLSLLGPIGLALIATEFVWARKLLTIAKDRSSGIRAIADRLASGSTRWLAVLISVGYWASVTLIALYDPVPQFVIWPMASFGFAPIFYWAVKVFKNA